MGMNVPRNQLLPFTLFKINAEQRCANYRVLEQPQCTRWYLWLQCVHLILHRHLATLGQFNIVQRLLWAVVSAS